MQSILKLCIILLLIYCYTETRLMDALIQVGFDKEYIEIYVSIAAQG